MLLMAGNAIMEAGFLLIRLQTVTISVKRNPAIQGLGHKPAKAIVSGVPAQEEMDATAMQIATMAILVRVTGARGLPTQIRFAIMMQ
jgi:hypothetical protein